jgi:hypothetical protein
VLLEWSGCEGPLHGVIAGAGVCKRHMLLLGEWGWVGGWLCSFMGRRAFARQPAGICTYHGEGLDAPSTTVQPGCCV